MSVKTEYSRQEAALQMLEDAILLEQEGRYASAITLCGAIEGMLPGSKSVFSNMKEAGRTLSVFLDSDGKPEEKKIIQAINEHRDWLKHSGEDKPDRLDIFDLIAVYFLFRAASAYWDAYDIENNIHLGSHLLNECLIRIPQVLYERQEKYAGELSHRN